LASFTLSGFGAPGAMFKRALPSWTTTFRPSRSTSMAVRTASEPMRLAEESAGQLSLIARAPETVSPTMSPSRQI